MPKPRQITREMKAISIVKRGGRNILQYGDVPIPSPREGEVLIRVKACALNHLDIHIRKGRLDVALPHISGSDVSGEIAASFAGADKFPIGQAVVINPAVPCGVCGPCKMRLQCEMVSVFGYKTQGGFAEYVTAPVAQVYPMPRNLSFVETAAFPLTFLTAYHMLVGRAQLQKDEMIFIWGASGGLGAAAIQIAKYLGAHIIAAAGTETDARRIKAMGADAVAIYSEGDTTEKVRDLTNGQGVDVVFESIGAETWERTLAMLRPYGRVVIAGTTTGGTVSQNLNNLYHYQHTILGSRMGTSQEFEEVLELMETGKLKPTIDKVFALKDFKEAQKNLEESKQVGKIVIEI